MDRMPRVNELLKRELGLLLERELRREGVGLVTVTDVKTAPDLHHAVVYVSVFGAPAQKTNVLNQLQRHRKTLQHAMARHVVLKFTPRLTFQLDETAENADRVTRLLDQLAKGTPPDARA
jgi:ribosome-binding factor A